MFRRLYAFIAYFMVCAHHAHADERDAAERLDAVIAPYVEAGAFRGVALAGRGDNVLFARGYGPARAGDPKPGDPFATRYPIGSVSKQMLAAILFQMEGEGVVDLAAPVSGYLPDECPKVSAPLLDLIRHTSGLAEVSRTKRSLTGAPDTEAAARARRICKRRAAKGGARFKYKNADYDVLTAVVEKIDAAPYADIVQSRIVAPLRLAHTGQHRAGVVPEDRADHFRLEETSGERRPIEGYRFENYLGSAGMYSNPGDLWRIDQALMRGELIPEAAFEKMSDGDPALGYAAYGAWAWPWRGPDGETRTVVQRHGWVGAFATLNLILPEDETVIVVISTVGPEAGLQTLWTGEGLGAELLTAVYAGGDAE
ncbi:MAG: serine hydrolase domain-containing protein [Pseudomonadota bacterium]